MMDWSQTMRKEVEIDLSQPALTLTYGGGGRRCRALDKEVFLLGRGSQCDLALVSPEVAPVHCIVVRTADGWRVRDCSGRVGTRVNGKNI
jgi:pSer/pThr/pTyr-binding forkhead associated (FHA) protein